MKRESKPKFTRQRWQEYSNFVQEEVNTFLDDMQPVIDEANERLVLLWQYNRDEAAKYAQQVIEYLNKKWGLLGEEFFISGTWYEPNVAISNEGIVVHHSLEEVCRAVKSNGFSVKSIEEHDTPGVPQIGMSFIVGQKTISTPALQGRYQALGFADPNEISLYYLRPLSPEVVSSSADEVKQTIERADSIFRIYTSHPDSTFYNQSAKKQQEFFRTIFDLVDSSLPSPETRDQAYLTEALVDKYLKTRGSEIAVVSAQEGKKIKMTGLIHGITIPEFTREDYQKQYTTPDELQSSETGLCLIVEVPLPDSGSGTELILVPCRHIDNVEITIY